MELIIWLLLYTIMLNDIDIILHQISSKCDHGRYFIVILCMLVKEYYFL